MRVNYRIVINEDGLSSEFQKISDIPFFPQVGTEIILEMLDDTFKVIHPPAWIEYERHILVYLGPCDKKTSLLRREHLLHAGFDVL